jgi:hypothetical protein
MNQFNRHPMFTRSRVQPGHTFIAMEYKQSYITGHTPTYPQWQIGLSKARTLINMDHYTIDEVYPMLEANTDNRGNISHRDYNTIMRKLVKGRGTIAAKDRTTIEMIVDNIFTAFQTETNLEVSFRQIATALTLFCRGNIDENISACFNLFDNDPNQIDNLDQNVELPISSIQEYLMCVFTIYYRFKTVDDWRWADSLWEQDVLRYRALEEIAYYPQEIGEGPYNSIISFDNFKEWWEEKVESYNPYSITKPPNHQTNRI